MLGSAQSVVGRCWSSKGLPLRRSSSVLRRSRMLSPHETYNDITKLLPASGRYLSWCLPIRPFLVTLLPKVILTAPHLRFQQLFLLGRCALPCLSGPPPNLLFLN